MKPSAAFAISLVAVATLAAGAHACAGCRNPNMPVNRTNAVQLRPGEMRAGLSLAASGIRVSHEAGCPDPGDCAEVPIQPAYMHDQDILPGEARISAELGLTPGMGVEVQAPFRIVRTSIDYSTPDGKPYRPLDPDVHHRDETLLGSGDPWLLGRWGGDVAGLQASIRAGVSLPFGSTEADPFVLGDQGKRHQHIQFGNGTFDPVLAFDVSKSLGRWLVSGFGQGQVSLYGNAKGYRAGPRVSGGAQAGRKLRGSLTGAMGLEALYEGPERWGGEIRQDGNLGRTEALASLAFVYAFRNTALGTHVRVPVYRHIVAGDEKPGDFSSPVMAGISVGRTFKAY